MPPRGEKHIGLPAVESPVLLNYSERLAILLFGQLMKWLRPMVRRGDSIPFADLKDGLWAVKEAWELHRDIARASGPQPLTAVPAEELDAQIQSSFVSPIQLGPCTRGRITRTGTCLSSVSR